MSSTPTRRYNAVPEGLQRLLYTLGRAGRRTCPNMAAVVGEQRRAALAMAYEARMAPVPMVAK